MKRFVVCAVLGLACSLPASAETAITARDTELKKEPFSDAATLATLPSRTAVEIIRRQGGWTQVKPATQEKGWVRMLALRMGNGAAKSGDSGLGALFNVARSGSSGTTVTTGVRGLSEEDLRNARPNPEELKRMQSHGVTPAEATKFATVAHLQRQSLDYLKAPASVSSPQSTPASTWEITP